MKLKPNDQTRAYAVPSGVIGTIAANTVAIALDHPPNFWLVVVAAFFVVLAICMEMYVMYKLPEDGRE